MCVQEAGDSAVWRLGWGVLLWGVQVQIHHALLPCKQVIKIIVMIKPWWWCSRSAPTKLLLSLLYSLFSLRLQSVTPAAAKGNWSRVFPCWETSNTSVIWLVFYSSAVIKSPHRGRSSKVCIISSFILLRCGFFNPDFLIKMLWNRSVTSSADSSVFLGSAGTGEATPVIANVISLAGPHTGKSSASDRTAQQSTQQRTHIHKYLCTI